MAERTAQVESSLHIVGPQFKLDIHVSNRELRQLLYRNLSLGRAFDSNEPSISQLTVGRLSSLVAFIGLFPPSRRRLAAGDTQLT